MDVLEQIILACLVLVILADVFLTVLYARMGPGILSPALGRGLWKVFRSASRPLGARRKFALSLAGPFILLSLLAVWAFGLTLGAALMIHPALGTAIQSGSGDTPRDFVTALFAGGSSMSIVGAGDFSPKTGGYKLLYLVFSLIGLSVTSLTLTYLMQVYTALQRRNALGFKLHLLSSETDDAAEIVAGLGPEGQFNGGYTVLANIASEMSNVKESHHFYPVLRYFRFNETFYSVSQFTLLALDSVSLIRSALDENELAWLQESGTMSQLWRSSLILVTSLEENFLDDDDTSAEPDVESIERWRRRYDAALRRFEQAHIPITNDRQAGFDVYRSLRVEWDRHIATIAPATEYELSEIDPVGRGVTSSDSLPAFSTRRHAPG